MSLEAIDVNNSNDHFMQLVQTEVSKKIDGVSGNSSISAIVRDYLGIYEPAFMGQSTVLKDGNKVIIYLKERKKEHFYFKVIDAFLGDGTRIGTISLLWVRKDKHGEVFHENSPSFPAKDDVVNYGYVEGEDRSNFVEKIFVTRVHSPGSPNCTYDRNEDCNYKGTGTALMHTAFLISTITGNCEGRVLLYSVGNSHVFYLRRNVGMHSAEGHDVFLRKNPKVGGRHEMYIPSLPAIRVQCLFKLAMENVTFFDKEQNEKFAKFKEHILSVMRKKCGDDWDWDSASFK